MILYIMQGIPGSGKSTVAKALALWFHNQELGLTKICSTDDYWGVDYHFDPADLGNAHSWNQGCVREAMEHGIPNIVVDNTNLTAKAWRPYLDLARTHGYAVQFIRVSVPIEVALERNAARPLYRRVPVETIRRMESQLMDPPPDVGSALYVD